MFCFGCLGDTTTGVMEFKMDDLDRVEAKDEVALGWTRLCFDGVALPGLIARGEFTRG